MRVYVAGPVTGVPELNRPAFEEAAGRIVGAGHTAIVPHWFVPADASWQDAMRTSLDLLAACEVVALLDGWERSRGAKLEARVAYELGMPVMTADGLIFRKGPDGRGAMR